jgi:hypothetical protein
VRRPTSELVAIILALGISVALNVVTVALLWAAYIRLGVNPNTGLSENGTQLLTGWGGGIIGIIGAYVGYSFGKRARDDS